MKLLTTITTIALVMAATGCETTDPVYERVLPANKRQQQHHQQHSMHSQHNHFGDTNGHPYNNNYM
jgi:hypothetical protein